MMPIGTTIAEMVILGVVGLMIVVLIWPSSEA